MESNIAQLVLGALHKKMFFASDIAANIGESERVTQGILDKLCESGKVVGEQVRNNIAYRLSDNPTAIEIKVLKAIDEKSCTLPQIKRHAELEKSFDLMPILEAMIFDGLIVRRTNESETRTAYFRKNLIPPKFYLGNGIVEGDWENAAPDDTEARMARARRKADELAFSPKEKEEEEIKSVVEKSQPKPGLFIAISAERVRKFAALGQTQEEIAESLDISYHVFQKRLKDTPSVREAYENGHAEYLAAKSPKKRIRKTETSSEEKKPRKPSPSPTRDKILANLAKIQTWAQEGKTKSYAAEQLGINPPEFSKYFKSIPELVQHWEKGLALKKPSSPRGRISASLDLIEQYAFEGKRKADLAEHFGIKPDTFINNYFYSIPGVKEAWGKGVERREAAQKGVIFDEVSAESENIQLTEKPKIEQAVKELTNNGLTPKAIDLFSKLTNESLSPFDKQTQALKSPDIRKKMEQTFSREYGIIPVTPEEDEAFDELAKKLNANDVAHKLKLDEEAAGDYVGKSLPTGLKNIVGDSAPGPVKLDCPPNCGHTKEQYEFFDSGYQNGLEGIASPYIDASISPDLRNIFLSGYSVGLICYRYNLKAEWKKRGYDDAVSGKANQIWKLLDHHLFDAEVYNEGYEDGLKERDANLVKAELKNESFLDHRGGGDEVPQGDWKILPAPKTGDGEKVEIVGVPVGGNGIEPVEIDPRFANTVNHLVQNGRSRESFKRKKQEFLNNLPALKIPDITSGRTFILPDTIEPRPGNFKTLQFGSLTVRLAVEGNLFDAPKEVREKLEGLFDWAEKNAK